LGGEGGWGEKTGGLKKGTLFFSEGGGKFFNFGFKKLGTIFFVHFSETNGGDFDEKKKNKPKYPDFEKKMIWGVRE